ncbi:hypothetical protein [Enterobacter sp. R4-368]|uniref:hypothetical protein n=1 Tax=Enterobacter sp. R4-368 TaxID=1166130 RepID=UPI0003AA66C2|nr:hypothetical protein [Enterobacter sp. R4-368]
MNIKFNFASWATISTYAIGNGILYSWSFWSVFNINILQFVSAYDLLPSVLFVLAIPLILYISYFFFSTLFLDPSEKFTEIYNDTSRPQWLRRCILAAVILTYLAGIVSLIYLYNITEGYFRTTVIVLAISLLVSFILIKKNKTILSEFGSLRRPLVYFIIITPIFIYTFASFKAANIINGAETFYVSSDSPCTQNTNTRYRYISSISDTAFAMSTEDNSLCIFKFKYLKLVPEYGNFVLKMKP